MEQEKHDLKWVFEKIQKLKALADKAGSPEEQANAMARMNEILTKYNVDLHTALNHKPQDKEVLFEVWDLNKYQGRHDGNTMRDLIFRVTQFNFARAVHTSTTRMQYDQGTMTIFANKVNMELVKYMVDYCITHMRIMEKDYWRKYNGPEKRGSYRRGFYRGCVNAITERLQAQRTQQSSNTMEIIHVGNKLVEEKLVQIFPFRGVAKRRGFISQEGKEQGYEAGKKLNLAQGLGGNNKPKGKLN